MRNKGFCSFILALNSLFASNFDWSEDQIRKYVHNSDRQRRWAISFMAPHLKELKGDEKILDVGCGDGKITADLSRFVPEGIVTGIDPSKGMLD